MEWHFSYLLNDAHTLKVALTLLATILFCLTQDESQRGAKWQLVASDEIGPAWESYENVSRHDRFSNMHGTPLLPARRNGGSGLSASGESATDGIHADAEQEQADCGLGDGGETDVVEECGLICCG